jgi:hypothetical protein
MRARTIRTFLLVAVVVVVVAPIACVTLIAAPGGALSVPSSKRDLDCDGSISMSEWYAAGLEDGWRPATYGPAGCWEVFRLKDGMPVTVWCPASPACRRAQ